ncbi:MAG: type I methionyl aminopeptidase [Clostridia bacterium]|nr:type I methionyl aminopeptidase [Clostridia bacterium]
MIIIKNSEQIQVMKRAGRITAEALLVAKDAIRPGISTKEIDTKIRHYIEKCGAKPSFLGYGGFPGSACISLNNEVIHGIPSASRILSEGDIVKVDVGACYRGYNGDSARTFAVGKVSDEALKLISVTEKSFYEAMRFARAGMRVGDIGCAVESFVISNGFSVVRDYVGHGVGASLHEEPEIPNFGRAGRGARLYSGMTLAIEPMVNVGTPSVKVLKDGWTVITADGALSAHYENSIVVTDSDPIILTDPDIE